MYAYTCVGSTHYLVPSIVVVPASKYITINTCNYVWVWYYMLYVCLDCTSDLDSVNSKRNVMIHVSPCSFEWYEVLQDDNNESGLLLHNSWRISWGTCVVMSLSYPVMNSDDHWYPFCQYCIVIVMTK